MTERLPCDGSVNPPGQWGRRAFLAGLAGLVAAPVASLHATASPVPGSLKVGDIEVRTFSDGTLTASLAFMLPNTTERDAERLLKAEGLSSDLPPTPTNVTLVRTGIDVVLIDAGSGGGFQATAGRLAEQLEGAGIEREAITKVVFTHGHADHLWGAIDDFDDTERFPNATYVAPSDEWDFWTRPDVEAMLPDWLKGMAIGSNRTFKRLEPKLERRKPGEAVAPGLTYLATTGHTPGHASVLVASGREQALIGGDALSHPVIAFRQPDWAFGSDLDRGKAAETRLNLLDRLATDRMALVGFHLPGGGIGHVERDGGAYRFVQG